MTSSNTLKALEGAIETNRKIGDVLVSLSHSALMFGMQGLYHTLRCQGENLLRCAQSIEGVLKDAPADESGDTMSIEIADRIAKLDRVQAAARMYRYGLYTNIAHLHMTRLGHELDDAIVDLNYDFDIEGAIEAFLGKNPCEEIEVPEVDTMPRPGIDEIGDNHD